MAPRRVNLLPQTLLHERRARQRTLAVVVAAAGVIALLVGAFLFQSLRLAGERDRLAQQQEENASLRAQVAELADIERQNAELRAKRALVDQLTRDEVRWSVILADISVVIPSEAWLTTFTGNVTAPATGAAAPTGGPVTLGSITLNGTTFRHEDVATWLTLLGEIEAFTLPYVTLSTKATIGETEVVNFNSSVQLSEAAFRRNQQGAQRRL